LQLVVVALVSAVLVYLLRAQFGFFGILVAILTGLVPIIGVIAYILRLERSKFEGSGLMLGGFALFFGLMLIFPLMNVVKPVFGCPKEIGDHIGYELKKSDVILLAKKEIHMVSLPFYLSQQARVEEVSDLNSLSNSDLLKYDAIVGDSLLSERINHLFSVEYFNCFDLNHQKHKDFYVMIRQ
jgi:hypothetical protein